MRYVIMSVYDRAACAYGRPAFGLAVGSLIRSFQDECNRVAEDNVMYKHAADYDLYELGSFDDGEAKFVILDAPKLLASGAQMVLKGVE